MSGLYNTPWVSRNNEWYASQYGKSLTVFPHDNAKFAIMIDDVVVNHYNTENPYILDSVDEAKLMANKLAWINGEQTH